MSNKETMCYNVWCNNLCLTYCQPYYDILGDWGLTRHKLSMHIQVLLLWEKHIIALIKYVRVYTTYACEPS